MKYILTCSLACDETGEYYLAEHPEFNGKCVCVGETPDQAISGLKDTLASIEDIYEEMGKDLPKPISGFIKEEKLITAVGQFDELKLPKFKMVEEEPFSIKEEYLELSAIEA